MAHLANTLLVTVSVWLVMASLTLQTPKVKREADDVICQNNVMNQLDQYVKQIQLVPNGKHRFPETIPKLREACK